MPLIMHLLNVQFKCLMVRQAVKNPKCTRALSPPIVSRFATARQALYLMSCGHICSKTNRCNTSITQRRMGEERDCAQVVRPPRLQHFQGPSQLPQTHSSSPAACTRPGCSAAASSAHPKPVMHFWFGETFAFSEAPRMHHVKKNISFL